MQIDSILIENHLKKLLSGKTIYSPRYNFFKHLKKKKEKNKTTFYHNYGRNPSASLHQTS